MRAMGHGAIIHIASICARHGNLSRSADGAFKGGVITLSRLKYRAPERPWLAGRGRA
jgi:NAD(P)-dependent dehydrogenase (short-subunit alcohol dehydrogenase family)